MACTDIHTCTDIDTYMYSTYAFIFQLRKTFKPHDTYDYDDADDDDDDDDDVDHV